MKKPTKVMLKKQAEDAFNRAVLDFIAFRWNAERPAAEWLGWKVDTKAGALFIRPHGDWISMRFEDPGAAVKLLKQEPPVGPWDINPYSGKWNIHMSGVEANDNAIVESSLRELERRLLRVGFRFYAGRENWPLAGGREWWAVFDRSSSDSEHRVAMLTYEARNGQRTWRMGEKAAHKLAAQLNAGSKAFRVEDGFLHRVSTLAKAHALLRQG